MPPQSVVLFTAYGRELLSGQVHCIFCSLAALVLEGIWLPTLCLPVCAAEVQDMRLPQQPAGAGHRKHGCQVVPAGEALVVRLRVLWVPAWLVGTRRV